MGCLINTPLHDKVVERRLVNGELSLFYAWPAADESPLCEKTNLMYKLNVQVTATDDIPSLIGAWSGHVTH